MRIVDVPVWTIALWLRWGARTFACESISGKKGRILSSASASRDCQRTRIFFLMVFLSGCILGLFLED